MKKILTTLSVITLVLSSCSNKVDFGELYKKELYIINSKEELYNASHAAEKDSKGNISIYVTGSEVPNEDIYVSYKVDVEALQRYNEREYGDNEKAYFSLIPEDKYTFESPEVVIKKGNPYGLLKFSINTEALDPEHLYVLPITITEAKGYEISESQHTILYVIRVSNNYVGDYASTYTEGISTFTSINKALLALSGKKVLIPIQRKSNLTPNVVLDFNVDYYQITIHEDNTLEISNYLQSKIYPDTNPANVSKYDPVKKEFTVFYIIKNKYDEAVNCKEIIKRI